MIRAQRTLIRPIKLEDEPDLFEIYNCPKVFEHFGLGPYSREKHRASIKRAVSRWIDKGVGDLAAAYKSKVIARLILFPTDHDDFEIGYVLNPNYWRMGFASELVQALTDHAFSVGASRVIACARESNVVSRRIIENLGYSEVERKLDNDGICRFYYQKLRAVV